MTFSKGDSIIVTCQDQTVDGVIMMASQNDVALMIGFDFILAGHVGVMPVFRGDDGVYRSVVDNAEVIIRRRLNA